MEFLRYLRTNPSKTNFPQKDDKEKSKTRTNSDKQTIKKLIDMKYHLNKFYAIIFQQKNTVE